jgi:hypothetical protein
MQVREKRRRGEFWRWWVVWTGLVKVFELGLLNRRIDPESNVFYIFEVLPVTAQVDGQTIVA